MEILSLSMCEKTFQRFETNQFNMKDTERKNNQKSLEVSMANEKELALSLEIP